MWFKRFKKCASRVYLWWIHFDVWQNEYNIVKFKNKIKLKKNKNKKCASVQDAN